MELSIFLDESPPIELLPDLCPYGHELTPDNVTYQRQGEGKLPRRLCRECRRAKPAHLEGVGRRDSLPEYTNFPDTGCDLHGSCLSCPLEMCKYDSPNGSKGMRKASREEQFAALREHGVSVTQAAVILGVSRRTCFRYELIVFKDKPKPARPDSARLSEPIPIASRNKAAIRAAVDDARRALRVLEALRA